MILLDVPVPDGIFWYTLCALLSGVLIWIINRYTDKTTKLLEQLVKNDTRQDTILLYHEKEIEELKKMKA